ncbi:MAG: addiction module protein [Thermodesulfobacteriota bacterium]
MSERGNEVLKEALSLPPAERAEIADRLLLTLNTRDQERVNALWAVEAEDRLDAFDQGEVGSVPAAEVFEELKRCTK